ncbi:MAG: PD-(D/E)XK nuclease family protein [bacterium]|nr:PD-(D/E)XK nuclease family protein [bacterium]
MSQDSIPRTHCFSLGDFHDFDRCVFRFFVNHHLGKKYELAEGSTNKVVGTLLDLALKKIHQTHAYGQPVEYLQNYLKAAELEIREDVLKRGKLSFYGAQLPYLTPEVVEKAKEIFSSYHQGIKGRFKKMVTTPTTKRIKPFWEVVLEGQTPLKMWGAPDAIEMGEDGIPEVVDYKYFEDQEKGESNLDMDLMPKLYTLFCAAELQALGFSKARFVVRLWQNPGNDAYYEEFDLSRMPSLTDFFKDKMERILRTEELGFCNKEYCKVCQHKEKENWIKELKKQGWIKQGPSELSSPTEESLASSDLPF